MELVKKVKYRKPKHVKPYKVYSQTLGRTVKSTVEPENRSEHLSELTRIARRIKKTTKITENEREGTISLYVKKD